MEWLSFSNVFNIYNKHKMLNNIAKKLIDKGLVKRQNVWSFWR